MLISSKLMYLDWCVVAALQIRQPTIDDEAKKIDRGSGLMLKLVN